MPPAGVRSPAAIVDDVLRALLQLGPGQGDVDRDDAPARGRRQGEGHAGLLADWRENPVQSDGAGDAACAADGDGILDAARDLETDAATP